MLNVDLQNTGRISSPTPPTAACVPPPSAQTLKPRTKHPPLSPSDSPKPYTPPAPDNLAQSWRDTLEQCAQKLRQHLPNADLLFVNTDNRQRLESFAKSLGQGAHIVISRGFLDYAASGQEAFAESLSLLKEIHRELQNAQRTFTAQGYQANLAALIDENGQVRTTVNNVTAQDDYQSRFFQLAYEGSVKYYKEKGGRSVTEIQTPNGQTIRMVITKRLGYRPGKDLARLARVTSQSAVKNIIGNVHGQIRRAKADKNLDQDEVRLAVAQMKAVINRAQTKIKQLEEEKQLDIRRKKAVEQKELADARALARELKRRRTLRRSREYGQISEHFPRNWWFHHTHRDCTQDQFMRDYLGLPLTAIRLETAAPTSAAPSLDCFV